MADEFTPRYVNWAKVQHNPNEFFVDFVTLVPELSSATGVQTGGQGRLVGRYIMSPRHAKALMEAIATNIRLYEQQYGDIGTAAAQKTDITLN